MIKCKNNKRLEITDDKNSAKKKNDKKQIIKLEGEKNAKIT